jgi:hypothetical protein
MVLRISDAGYLDEYIYDAKGEAIGETATRWVQEHPERMQTFRAWARKEGLIKTDTAAQVPATAGEESAVASGKASRGPRPASRRHQDDDGLQAHVQPVHRHGGGGQALPPVREGAVRPLPGSQGPGQGACPRKVVDLRERARAEGFTVFLVAMRCSQPGDEIYEGGRKGSVHRGPARAPARPPGARRARRQREERRRQARLARMDSLLQCQGGVANGARPAQEVGRGLGRALGPGGSLRLELAGPRVHASAR